MIYFFLILIICVLYKMKFCFKDYNKQYMSKENTACIKGIFIVIVFFSHIRQYMTYDAVLDKPLIKILLLLGQLMVAMFMFYSGFGIYESIKRKKEQYVKNMPRNRILKTMLHLAIAIISFIICNLFIDSKYSIKDTLLAFTGWTNIGNSNWYMFAILSLYLLTFVSFVIFKKNYKLALYMNTILVVIYIVVIGSIKQSYWVNTCLCYVAGMWYSYYIDKINEFFEKYKKGYYGILIFTFITFTVLYMNKNNIAIYSIMAVVFCLVIVLATMRISINNKILLWLGKNLFWIYILQRLPMRVLEKVKMQKDIYFGVCLLITIALTYTYSKFVPYIERCIFKDKNKTRENAKN